MTGHFNPQDFADLLIDTPATRIIDEVCEQWRVRKDVLLSRRRTAHVAAARKAAMRAVRERTGLSYPKIGRLFGRDHTTVVWACRK